LWHLLLESEASNAISLIFAMCGTYFTWRVPLAALEGTPGLLDD
jgi:hypothetical protein